MNISEPEKNKSPFPSIKGEMLDRLSKEAEGRASHAKSIDHKKVYKRKGGGVILSNRKVLKFVVFANYFIGRAIKPSFRNLNIFQCKALDFK